MPAFCLLVAEADDDLGLARGAREDDAFGLVHEVESLERVEGERTCLAKRMGKGPQIEDGGERMFGEKFSAFLWKATERTTKGDLAAEIGSGEPEGTLLTGEVEVVEGKKGVEGVACVGSGEKLAKSEARIDSCSKEHSWGGQGGRGVGGTGWRIFVKGAESEGEMARRSVEEFVCRGVETGEGSVEGKLFLVSGKKVEEMEESFSQGGAKCLAIDGETCHEGGIAREGVEDMVGQTRGLLFFLGGLGLRILDLEEEASRLGDEAGGEFPLEECVEDGE